MFLSEPLPGKVCPKMFVDPRKNASNNRPFILFILIVKKYPFDWQARMRAFAMVCEASIA